MGSDQKPPPPRHRARHRAMAGGETSASLRKFNINQHYGCDVTITYTPAGDIISAVTLFRKPADALFRGDRYLAAQRQPLRHYDPLAAPNPEQWFALAEHERVDLARDYHRSIGVRVANAGTHAALHAIVETQIALRDATPARRIVQRLMDEGLDRHEAIHAIGAVLAQFIHDLPESGVEPNAPYFAALERITAKDRRR